MTIFLARWCWRSCCKSSYLHFLILRDVLCDSSSGRNENFWVQTGPIFVPPLLHLASLEKEEAPRDLKHFPSNCVGTLRVFASVPRIHVSPSPSWKAEEKFLPLPGFELETPTTILRIDALDCSAMAPLLSYRFLLAGGIHSGLSRSDTARGSYTGLVTVGLTKV